MDLSVVIPVRNGAATLEICLQSLTTQTKPPFEIIVIDTCSSDNSKEIALKYGAKVIDIMEENFDHGLTRNLGASYCSGDLIYFTVQDARIARDDMLEKMSAHFEDPEVMAVCGHQAVPHDKDKNPVRWYRRYSEYNVRIRQIEDVEGFRRMDQKDQTEMIAWDNVVAMYRKTALKELPFVQSRMAEDWMWSYQALLKGWKLIRDSSLEVYHYHHLTVEYVFRSTWSASYHFYKFFGYKPRLPAVVVPGVKTVYHLFRNRELSLREKLYWSRHNLMASMSQWVANLDFLVRLKLDGKNELRKKYRQYCKKIPQGRQK